MDRLEDNLGSNESGASQECFASKTIDILEAESLLGCLIVCYEKGGNFVLSGLVLYPGGGFLHPKGTRQD